jgi:hypothetical protein
MQIDVLWDNPEKTVARWEMSKGWSLSDFRYALKLTAEMTEATQGWFDLIINANQHTPPQTPLAEFQRGLTDASPRLGVLVVCNAHLFAKMLLEALRKMNVPNTDAGKLHFADTLDAARALVAQQRKLRDAEAPTVIYAAVSRHGRTGRLIGLGR